MLCPANILGALLPMHPAPSGMRWLAAAVCAEWAPRSTEGQGSRGLGERRSGDQASLGDQSCPARFLGATATIRIAARLDAIN
jgi:hypothetical protein